MNQQKFDYLPNRTPPATKDESIIARFDANTTTEQLLILMLFAALILLFIAFILIVFAVDIPDEDMTATCEDFISLYFLQKFLFNF